MKIKEKLLEEFDDKLEKYNKDGGFIEYVEGYDCNDFDVESIKDFISKALAQTREETIREIIGMCVNFDDYNNDQIISKEMLEELLNKLKK